MFGRQYTRFNRRDLGFDGYSFVPTYISGLVLWLRADLGITTINAAVVSPNDLSTGSWPSSNLSGKTATTLTEDATAGVAHFVSQGSGVSLLQANHLYHVKVGVPAASGNGRYVIVASGSAAEAVYLDCQAGTVLFTDGAVSNVVYASGVLDYDAVSPVAPTIYLAVGDGTHSLTHNGNGARTATFADNGLGALVSVTQRNVSAWADQSGAASNFTQGTGAAQPLYVASGLNGQPTLRWDGVDDGLTCSTNHGAGRDVFMVVKQTSIANKPLIVSGTTATGWSIGYLDAGSNVWNDHWVATVDQGRKSSGGQVNDTNWHVLTCRSITGSEAVWNNGTQIDTAVTVGGFGPTLPDAIGTNSSGSFGAIEVAEVIYFNRALTTTERQSIERYLGKRYGLAVA